MKKRRNQERNNTKADTQRTSNIAKRAKKPLTEARRSSLFREIPMSVSLITIGILVIIISSYTSYRIGEISERYRKREAREEQQTDLPQLAPVFNEIRPVYLKTDVENLITTKTPDEIIAKRNELIQFIWGKEPPFKTMPSKIDDDFYDSRYDGLYATSLKRIDHILINMEYNLKSNVYHFIPKKGNGKLVLFHQGHRGDFIASYDVIRDLLEAGYSVAGFCMPLMGLNNHPEIYQPRFGYMKLTSHIYMQFLKPEQGQPVKYFIEPVIVFLNYAGHSYKDIAMMGISGGGWTTTLAAAIDNRIRTSFPVAGSYPMYLRYDSSRDWGDYEQTIPDLYRVCNYLELYVLGSYGDRRRQLQIINRYDSCCFGGVKWQTYYPVLRKLSENMENMNWDLFMDESHAEHKISQVSQKKVLSILNGRE